MTISIRSNGIRELLSPGKPEHLPWSIYDVIGPPIVIGMLVGMIVWGVAGKVFGGKVGPPQRPGA